MKINAPSMAAFHRETPKASQAMRAERMEQKTAATESGKTAPPGLERVLARLEAMGDRTAGQTNAMDRIGRNLARYIETQAMADTPAPVPLVDETVVTEAENLLAESPEAPEPLPVAEAGGGTAVEVPEVDVPEVDVPEVDVPEVDVPEVVAVPDEGALLDALIDSAAEEPAPSA